MPKRLPPLLALEAFDAAARHMSFKAAAAELHLTPSAISHRVKQLEQHLGLSLFRRLNREIRLTEAGQDYANATRKAFDQVVQASARLSLPRQAEELRLSAVPHFATLWIIPHLEGFLDTQQGLRLYVESSQRNADFARDAVDAAIRYGNGRWPGLSATRLTDISVAPVCAPKLLAGLKHPRDLAQHTIIHLSAFPDAWPRWLSAVKAGAIKPKREIWVDNITQTVDAAERGLGVALGLSPLIAPRLKEDRLALPFTPPVKVDGSYWFVCRRAEADKPRLVALRDWLLRLMDEAHALMQPFEAAKRPKRRAR
jgi:LysR family transcriptional regulator, glycine cleavage system transcriptional activator